MSKNDLQDLSKRERQIMDMLFKLKRATVAEIVSHLDNPPSYNSIRVTLTILERKGYVAHVEDGQRYRYSPTAQPEKVRLNALEHMLGTLFQGSASDMVSSLLNLPSADISEKELATLSAMIEKARRESGK